MIGNSYHIPLSLTVISGIFLILGAVFAIGVAVDIFLRRGWRSMKGIMIPVYIINATYLGPFGVWVYYKFGRPPKPSGEAARQGPACCSSKPSDSSQEAAAEGDTTSESSDSMARQKTTESDDEPPSSSCQRPCHKPPKPSCHAQESTAPRPSHHSEAADGGEGGAHACHISAARPFWATVLVGVFHCGAGCVLGDVVGEWVAWASGASIAGQTLWAELLIDYAFALLFGIFFQYFSIAPISGRWGPMTVVRAAKADVLSLTSFEVGAFGWMVAFQAGIFDYRVSMMSWLYWWMMQMGMILGVATAYPANIFLLKYGVKEACC